MKIIKSLCLIIFILSSCINVLAQDTIILKGNDSALIVYFLKGVSRNVTATPPNSTTTVTSGNILSILTSLGIPVSNIIPSFPNFNLSDTTLTVSDSLTTITSKEPNKAKIFSIYCNSIAQKGQLLNALSPQSLQTSFETPASLWPVADASTAIVDSSVSGVPWTFLHSWTQSSLQYSGTQKLILDSKTSEDAYIITPPLYNATYIRFYSRCATKSTIPFTVAYTVDGNIWTTINTYNFLSISYSLFHIPFSFPNGARVRILNPAGTSTDLFIDSLSSNGSMKIPEVMFAESHGDIFADFIPSDNRFLTQQWALYNQSNIGKDIHAVDGWDIYKGNPNSIIAIVDFGSAGDPVNGWNGHYEVEPKIVGGDKGYEVDINGAGDHYTHGIMTAGIAAAVSNNDVGMAGVDHNAKIYAVRLRGGTN